MAWQERVEALHETMDRLYAVQAEVGPDSDAWRPLGKQIEDVRDQIRRTGPFIPDSPGATVPAWMDPEEAAEYRMSAEYAHDLAWEPDYDMYDDSFYENDDADYYAERDFERESIDD